MIKKMAQKKAQLPTGTEQTVVTASIRVDRDLSNLDGTSAKCTAEKDNLQVLYVQVNPPDGVWRNGTFKFRINVPDAYPHEPPKVMYLGPNRIWHPNIEGDEDREEWGVCLNILRKDWKPVLGIRDVLFGLEMLFFEPNIDDPLPGTAKLAAMQLKHDKDGFVRTAQQWAKGAYTVPRVNY